MTRNRFDLLVMTIAVMVLAGLVVRQGVLTARLTATADLAAGEAPQPVYYDLNNWRLYRASEWGVTAQPPAHPSWFDVSGLTVYQASEGRRPPRAAQPAPWFEVSGLEHYRASEWGTAAAARAGVCAYFDQSIETLRAVYRPEMGVTVAQSATGVLGVEGGLMAIKGC